VDATPALSPTTGNLPDMNPEEIPPWELRRPDVLLSALADLHPFDRPSTLLMRIDGPYEQQVLAGATLLWEEPPLDLDGSRRLTEEALDRLGCNQNGRWPGRPPLVAAVVVRPGASSWSQDETDAANGLRYGCGGRALGGDILTVTARGWRSGFDDISGPWPRARWRSPDEGQQVVAAAEAVLAEHADVLTRPGPGECLYHYLLRMLEQHGCRGHRFTEQWAAGRRVRGRPVLQWAVETGGCCCDCEVILNSFGKRSTRRVGLLCRAARAELAAHDELGL
jgi:hypothetical protein